MFVYFKSAPTKKVGADFLYKYLIETQKGEYLYKADPFAFYAEKRPSTASVVYDLDKYEWKTKGWEKKRGAVNDMGAPISIYEVHLGSWRRNPDEGMRYLTYKEMAKELGVSPTTVSNVINGRTEKMSEQTKLRIEEMLVKYHYVQDSRGGRNSQEELKLVVVEFFFEMRERIFTDPFCSELLESITRELEGNGRSVVCSTVQSEEEFLKKLTARNVEGAIILGCDPDRCEELCRGTSKPLVFVDSGEGNYDNIGLRDREGAREITSYLIKQ